MNKFRVDYGVEPFRKRADAMLAAEDGASGRERRSTLFIQDTLSALLKYERLHDVRHAMTGVSNSRRQE